MKKTSFAVLSVFASALLLAGCMGAKNTEENVTPDTPVVEATTGVETTTTTTETTTGSTTTETATGTDAATGTDTAAVNDAVNQVSNTTAQ